MTVGDFPDFDAPALWQGDPLYAQVSGNFPAALTVLYAGPITTWPSLLLRCFATQGGVRVRLDWYLDAALTQSTGNDFFDAPQGQGFYALYEVQAPFVKIRVVAVTAAPAGQGVLLILPTRSPALGFRPLVTPQMALVNNVTIPAGATQHFPFTFVVIGSYQFAVTAVAPAGAISFSLETLNYDGTVASQLVPLSVANPGGAATNIAPAQPLRLTLTNTTGAPATVSAFMISQEQGW